MENKKHKKIVEDYTNQKRKHLEKLSDKILKTSEQNQRLKTKQLKGNFLHNF
jgi:hypothetical protein